MKSSGPRRGRDVRQVGSDILTSVRRRFLLDLYPIEFPSEFRSPSIPGRTAWANCSFTFFGREADG